MKTRHLTFTAILLAILLFLAFSPFGFIQLGVIKATLIHIPVIIASILLGPRLGALMGFAFGCCSLAINTMSPTLLSFVFSPFIPIIGTQHGSILALVVVFIPRILLGIFPYYLNQTAKKVWNTDVRFTKTRFFLIGLLSTLLHTILVMSFIFILFKEHYEQAVNIHSTALLIKAILSIVLTNGLAEAIVAGLVCGTSLPILNKYVQKK